MNDPKGSDKFFNKTPFPLHQDAYQPDTKLLFSLIHSLPLNIYAKDKAGKFIFANSFYCKSVGKDHSEIIGKNDFEIHPAGLAEKYLADDKRIMETRQTESIEEGWQSLGGKLSYTQVIKTPLYDNVQQKELIGTLGIFWDISERKRADIILAEERNLLRTLIDNLPDYIYVKDLESRFVIANTAVARLMGEKNPESLISKTDVDYYSATDAQKFIDVEKRILQSGIGYTDLEESFHNQKGQVEWCLTSKLPLRNLDDEIVGLVGMGHNITERKRQESERKQLEAQLLHSQKMETIGTLTAGIAHDFNNLLNIINGYAELLMLKISPDNPDHSTLNKILHAGRSAAMLVSQLMMFSRKGVTQLKVLDFNELLINTQQMLRRIIGEEIDIQQDLAADLWPIKADSAQMEQVIVNLAANARDAMRVGGVLKMVTKNVSSHQKHHNLPQGLPPGDYICFIVTDNGTGIKKEDQERIFEPFFTTKEKHKGTGLGLATVFGILQQNGGGINLESQEGRGTTFRIFLPKTLELQDFTDSISVESALPCGSETILVVEDQEDVRNLVVDVLKGQGYLVMEASDGQEAIRLVEGLGSGSIDLLITDVVMPGMSGKILVEKLHQQHSDIKILFMSGYTDDAISQYDISQPGMEFIQKPFSSAEIGNKVRSILDSTKM